MIDPSVPSGAKPRNSRNAKRKELHMNRRYAAVAVVSAVLSLVGAPSAHAAARVFVSVNGTDAGNCSDVNAPCRTLNFAINAVDPGGEVIVLTTGSYAGASITKSVKLNSPSGVVAFSASTITVNAGTSDVVVLRGLTLKALTPGSGTGINFTAGAALHVENCVVDGWNIGINVAPTPAADVYVNVSDTVVRNNAAEGLLLTNNAAVGVIRAAVERSRFENNGMPGQTGGVWAVQGVQATISNSVATGNFRGYQAGGLLSGPGVEMNIESCVSAGNVVGIFTSTNTGVVTARVSNTTVTNNTLFGLEAQGGSSLLSRSNNTVEGNAAAETFTGTYAAK
jgi:hypothetical protein